MFFVSSSMLNFDVFSGQFPKGSSPILRDVNLLTVNFQLLDVLFT